MSVRTEMHGMTSADWHFIQHLPQTTLTTAMSRMMNIFLSSLIAGCNPSTTSHDRNTQNPRSHCLVRWRPVIPEITCWPAFLRTAGISGRKIKYSKPSIITGRPQVDVFFF